MRQTQRINFYRDPNIKGVEICSVEKSCHIFPNHAHDDIYALSLIVSGATYCKGIQNSDLTVNESGMVLLNPGQVHSGVPVNNTPISYWMIYIDIQTMKSFASHIFEKEDMLPEFNQMILRNKEIASHFQSVLNGFTKSRDSFENEILLHEFLYSLFNFSGAIKPVIPPVGYENEAVNLARDYLSQDLDSGLSLDNLARKVGISRFHFIRLFKKHMGVSPHQFRIQRRIQASKSLIRKGLPLSEVALETGFSDQSHFTNKFRQYTGATPSQYAHH